MDWVTIKNYVYFNSRAFIAILWKNIKIKYFARRVFLLNEVTMFLFFFIQVALMGLAFRIEYVGRVEAPFFSWALIGFLI